MSVDVKGSRNALPPRRARRILKTPREYRLEMRPADCRWTVNVNFWGRVTGRGLTGVDSTADLRRCRAGLVSVVHPGVPWTSGKLDSSQPFDPLDPR